MVLSNVLMLSQISGHVVAFILSLCVIVPLSLHVHEFSGKCLLFTSGTWRTTDGLYDVAWASVGYCGYSITTGVLLFLISSLQIYRLIRLVLNELQPSFIGLLLDVVIGFILCAMTLVSAIIITLGFIVWCSGMTQRFPSCEIAAGQNITQDDQHVDMADFYVEMGTAQFGAWSSFAMWVGLTVFALLKLINDHQMRNIRVSMYLERQRLVNEYGYRDGGGDGQSTPPLVDELHRSHHHDEDNASEDNTNTIQVVGENIVANN